MIVTSGQNLVVDTTWIDSSTQQNVSGSELFDSNGNVLEYMSGVMVVSNVTVNNGGYLNDFGTASGTMVSSGGTFYDFGTASGTVVSSGGTLYVADYGTANGTVVSSGGTFYDYGTASGTVVSSGGIIFGLTLNNGDTYTSNGYNMSGTTIESGAIVLGLTVAYGGSTSGFVVSSGVTLDVENGGTASGTMVSSGGTLIDYGTASGTVVSSGGTLIDYGTASGTVVSSGGIISGLSLNSGDTYTSNGYNISGTTIESGAIVFGLNIGSGGSTSGFVVSSGGTLDVYDDGTASGTVVSSGGTLDVYDGGTASGTVVSSGGTLDVYDDGTASGIVVSSGGTLDVYGTASDIVVSSGGTLYDDGTASGIVVSSGGTLYDYGTASDIVVSHAGDVIVGSDIVFGVGIVFGDIKGSGSISFRYVNENFTFGTFINVRNMIISFYSSLSFYENIKVSGQILQKIGTSITIEKFKTLKLTGTSTFFGAISGNGTLYFASGRDTFGNSSIITVANVFISNGAIISVDTVKSQKVSFAGNGGDLELTNVAHFKSAISGFGSGDTLDLTGFGFASGATLAFSENAARTKGKLIVTEGSQQFSVFLLGQYSQAGFHEASDGQAGTSITYTPPASLKPTLLLGAHS